MCDVAVAKWHVVVYGVVEQVIPICGIPVVALGASHGPRALHPPITVMQARATYGQARPLHRITHCTLWYSSPHRTISADTRAASVAPGLPWKQRNHWWYVVLCCAVRGMPQCAQIAP